MEPVLKLGLMYYSTIKYENDANRPSCFQQLQADVVYLSPGTTLFEYKTLFKSPFSLKNGRHDSLHSQAVNVTY